MRNEIIGHSICSSERDTDPTPAPPLHGRGVPTGNGGGAAPLPCRGGAGVGSVIFLGTTYWTAYLRKLNNFLFLISHLEN